MTTSVHQRTPSLTVNDGRDLPVCQIAYLRTLANETAIALVTRQRHRAVDLSVECPTSSCMVPPRTLV